MPITIEINQEEIEKLDISPVVKVVEGKEAKSLEQQIGFNINYPREASDPRELSEIPEIRLWFIALDSYYPWFPFYLNWREGELARYAAMLVPHEFSRTEGIRYNPEALDIWIMQKVFTLHRWLTSQNLKSHSRLKAMAQIFGYELEDSFFQLLPSLPL